MGGKRVQFHFHPGKVVTAEEFIGTHEPFSMAWDGYVYGPSWFDARGPWANFNHHEGCVRTATLCTAEQIWDAVVLMSLFETYKRCGHHYAHVFCNDADEDNLLASYIMRHPSHTTRPRLKQIKDLQGDLDRLGGNMAVRKRWQLLMMWLWCLQPYAEARMSGEIERMNGEEMLHLMEMTHGRIRRMLCGRGGMIKPDTDFNVLERHGKFAVIEEVGRYARFDIARQGFEAYLSVAKLPRGRLKCSLVRKQFISWFPLPKLYAALNEAEGLDEKPKGKEKKIVAWGGSDLVGGSPRIVGSALELRAIVDDVILPIMREQESRMCHTGQRKH